MKNYLKLKLNRFYIYRLFASKIHKYNALNNPKTEANRAYYPFFKKVIDWDAPKNLIEKIYWIQLYGDTSLWSKYADKYLARKYFVQCGYEKNIPKLYGRFSEASEINFEKLPKSFVLKTNNGCGTVLIVKNKSNINNKFVIKKLNRWLSIPFGYRGAQLHYTSIKPCILAEELLVNDEKDNLISPNSLIDYKVYCVNGKPEAIWVSYDRTYSGVMMTMYDTNWNKTPQHLKSSNYYKYSKRDIPKPLCLHEMLEMAKKLSKPFSQVRVDFYIIDNRPIIGEMTFTTGWSFFTYDFYNYLGSKIDLTKAERVQ